MRHSTLSNIGEFHASESSVVGDGGGARRKEGGLLHKKRGGGEGDRRRIKSLNHARSILGQFLRLLEKEGGKGKRAHTQWSPYSFLRILRSKAVCANIEGGKPLKDESSSSSKSDFFVTF